MFVTAFTGSRTPLAPLSEGRFATHSEDVANLSHAIAHELRLPAADRRAVLAAARLHHLGKLAVPKEIADKDAPLDETEWAVVRDQNLAGERILRSLPEAGEFSMIIRASNERWDGSGYPDGLCGEEIPIASRIIHCADAYIAMCCERPYRPRRTPDEALEEIRSHAGTQFDPHVVEALVTAAPRLAL